MVSHILFNKFVKTHTPALILCWIIYQLLSFSDLHSLLYNYSMPYDNYQPMLEITRGPVVESIHYGAAAVVDVHGQLLASWGDPNTVTYLRSSAKPIQALPLIELGGSEAFGFTEQEIAVMCASHHGTDDHVAVVRGIQKKINASESDLLCGFHDPGRATLKDMILRGEEPSPIRHNCSGKHTGMLAQALLRSLTWEDYINPSHPVQQLNLKTFAEMTSMNESAIALGTDGCSAPVYAIPLYNAALAFARLSEPDGLEYRRATACRRIVQAMIAHPDMIAGEGGFDTVLMQYAGVKVFTKGGAEGYQVIGLLPGALYPGSPGAGIAIKIADGDLSGRARPVASIEILRQLGVFSDEEAHSIPRFSNRTLTNWRKLEIGEIRSIFTLEHTQEAL
jgi:L-asparaginase II